MEFEPDTEGFTPDPETPDAPAAGAAGPSAQAESPLSFRAKALQTACDDLSGQVKAACATSDQPGYHAAQNWLTEAARALRKAAAQCEEAEAAAAPVGEV